MRGRAAFGTSLRPSQLSHGDRITHRNEQAAQKSDHYKPAEVLLRNQSTLLSELDHVTLDKLVHLIIRIKTLKYAPTFPERFGCLADARGFLADLVQWYNHEHKQSGIGLHTAADVHYGLAAAKATDRAATLTVARAANPERFSTSTPPKILRLPDSA